MATKQSSKTTKTTKVKRQAIQEINKKKKGVFTKILVVVAFSLIITYTSIVLIWSANGWVVPDSLTVSFFTAMIGELSILGIVKSYKLKKTI